MCRFCNDTGSTEKTLTGYLDCGYCSTADERMKLETWARREAPDVGRVELWTIYQHGKATQASQNK